MNLLMAKEMNQYKIAVVVFTPKGSCDEMVDLQFLIVEEGFPTFSASALLPLGEFLP